MDHTVGIQRHHLYTMTGGYNTNMDYSTQFDLWYKKCNTHTENLRFNNRDEYFTYWYGDIPHRSSAIVVACLLSLKYSALHRSTANTCRLLMGRTEYTGLISLLFWALIQLQTSIPTLDISTRCKWQSHCHRTASQNCLTHWRPTHGSQPHTTEQE